MIKWTTLLCLIGMALGACSTAPPQPGGQGPRVSLPAFRAWYNDKTVYYITTEISDPTMAQMMGATHSPRLRDAIPAYPKLPDTKTVLERVYKFAPGVQDSVFASVPEPIGPTSSDVAYSPLWLVYTVSWKTPSQTHLLTSEKSILDTEARGEVSVERTNIVINCPIVGASSHQVLPNAVITE